MQRGHAALHPFENPGLQISGLEPNDGPEICVQSRTPTSSNGVQ
jgi:hypothetical protein